MRPITSSRSKRTPPSPCSSSPTTTAAPSPARRAKVTRKSLSWWTIWKRRWRSSKSRGTGGPGTQDDDRRGARLQNFLHRGSGRLWGGARGTWHDEGGGPDPVAFLASEGPVFGRALAPSPGHRLPPKTSLLHRSHNPFHALLLSKRLHP